MTVWYHLSTIFNRRSALRIAGLFSLCVALTTTLLFANVSHAVQSTNKTINFQGRLMTSTGATVPDGHYNIQFKIYQGGSGTAVGNPDGTLKWTESYINNGGTSGVEVKNGFFTVNLGSSNPFGSSVDWDQDTLFLSMNVAGSAAGCTTFGTAPCSADGEMLQMKRITASPYAIDSGAVGGKTADNLVQLAQGVQTDASSNTSSIYINKTGTGNLIQLQNSGTDIFSITNSGDLEFGSGSSNTIYSGTAPPGTVGGDITVRAGDGGSGTGSGGGALSLQGGSAGGTNGTGGDVSISGGSGTGTGTNGSVYIGATNTDTVQIGSSALSSGTQTIDIGTSNTAGGTTNVTIGSGGSASGGSTNIQSKDDTSISTNGTKRATFAGDSNTLFVGNADGSGQATTANGFTIQGTSSTASDTQGGSLNLQAGSATSGNANGGNLTLTGGSGSGTGSDGLVVINTPTFQTASSDANCYTAGSVVASSCTFTNTSVNSSAVLVAGFSTDGQVASLPDPANTTAGRILYITAANGTKDFTLRANNGAGTGVEQNIILKQNTTATMIWNGSDWTSAGGGTDATTLQTAYANSPQAAGNAELVINKSTSPDGLTIRDSSADPINSNLLQVQSSDATSVFSVNSGVTNYASDPGAEVAGADATSFPANTWGQAASSTVRYTTPGTNIASGSASIRIDSATQSSGAYNTLTTALAPNTTYNVSLSARLDSGSAPLTDLGLLYSPDGGGPFTTCITDVTITSTEWKKITCSFTTPSSGITSDNIIALGQLSSSTAHAYYIDNLSVTSSTNAAPNVQIGGGNAGGPATTFTLDKSASAPTGSGNALLGSMYYDTTIGKVQCYEADGWGSCGASPDTFVTLSPEYAGAVTHGSGIGTMSSDLCSDALNINDGTSSQPTICGSKETYNFNKWTSAETTDQSRSIFITYQLPSSFKGFAPNSTSLTARTDSTDSTVDYQIYRNNSTDGLTGCGSDVPVSTGAKTSWQKATATSTADPSTCGFVAGDSIVFRINLTAKDNANAYTSNLGFTFTNQ